MSEPEVATVVENTFLKDIKRGVGAEKMSDEQSELFVRLCLAESSDHFTIPPGEETWLMQVIDQRVRAMNLPIKFTAGALVGMEVLSKGVVGRMVCMLVDCLTEYEDQEVSLDMLTMIYPGGHYNEEKFGEYIDTMLKPRKVKWAEIY